MGKQVFRSKIDWWIWCIILFTACVTAIACIGLPWWTPITLGTSSIVLLGIGVFGIKYEIAGDNLLIHCMLRSQKLPISKIKEVKYCTGILAMPAASTQRIAIKFTDRRILKSSMPIEVSPKNREAFVSALLKTNPDIKVINQNKSKGHL